MHTHRPLVLASRLIVVLALRPGGCPGACSEPRHEGKPVTQWTAALINAFRDPEGVVRNSAVQALGEIGSASPDAVELLRTLQDDPDRNVRVWTKALLDQFASAEVPQAIAAIRELGGTIERDKTQPGRPLVTVALPGTNVTDAGIKHLTGLKRLQKLDLSFTRVTDAAVKELASLHGLQELSLAGTEVTPAALEGLAALKQLRVLSLSWEVTHERPKEFARLKQLRTLLLFVILEKQGAVSQVLFSPDGQLLVTLTTNGARIWKTATWKECYYLKGAFSVGGCFSADSRFLALRDRQKVKIWDLRTGKETAALQRNTEDVPLAFSSDSKRLAVALAPKVASKTQWDILVWDIASGTQETTAGKNVEAVDLSWGFCGFEMSGAKDRSGVEKLTQGKARWSPQRDKQMDQAALRFFDFGSLKATTRDGKTTAIIYHDPRGSGGFPFGVIQGGVITLNNTATGKEFSLRHGDPLRGEGIECLAFSNDGNRIACGDGKHVTVWDVATGRRIAKFYAPRHQYLVFTPNEKGLIVGPSLQAWLLTE
jgi:WD40 repeat protein